MLPVLHAEDALNRQPVSDLPPVSCACMTYGRPRLLEEAIASFLQQDYPGPKELVVLNDYAQQFLVCDHPEVTIVNVPKRFRTVGEKMAALVALCAHDLIFVWDDDDIYLPHRISFSVQHFDPARGFFKADKAWFWNNGQISGPLQNIFHAGSCCSRQLYDAVRGYGAVTSDYDQHFEARLVRYDPNSVVPFSIDAADIYYIYRWGGTGSYHLSALVPNEYHQLGATLDQKVMQAELEQGRVTLHPHWAMDYIQQVGEFLG